MSDLEIKKSIDKMCEMVAAVQSKNDELLTKYDGLTKTEIKGIQEKMDGVLVELEKAKSERKEAEEKSKRFEAILARGVSEGKASKPEIAEYKNHFANYLRKGKDGAAISSEVSDAYIRAVVEREYDGKGVPTKEIDMLVKTLRSDVGPEGGYFLLPEKGPIIKGRYFETTPMPELATVRQITGNAIMFPLDDGQMGDITWTGQTTLASTAATTTPQIGQINMFVNEAQAQVSATQSMLDDMPDVESWLMDKINDKYYRNLNTAYVAGDGASKPKGFLSYAAWAVPSTIAGQTAVYQRNAIEQVASGVADNISADGIKCLQAALLEEYQANAVWIMKRMTWSVVSELKDGVGRYLINPNTAALQNGIDLMLLGRPVVFGNDMQTIGANSLSIAYGDFKRGYTIVERLGMRILRDPYTSTPLILYKAFRRVDGQVTNFQAIKLLKCAAS